jgi:hypothetical protein
MKHVLGALEIDGRLGLCLPARQELQVGEDFLGVQLLGALQAGLGQ